MLPKCLLQAYGVFKGIIIAQARITLISERQSH